MRTSHARCLLCLNDEHVNSDMYVWVHVWSRYVNIHKTCDSSLCLCVCACSSCGWELLCLSCWAADNLNTPFSSCHLLRKRFFSSPRAPPALSSDWLRHFTQTVGHSPRARGTARLEGGGQASRAVPHQPRWGECRPFMAAPGRLSTICSLPLKCLLPSAETSADCDLVIYNTTAGSF